MSRTRISGRPDRLVVQHLKEISKARAAHPFGVAGLTCGRCVGALMDTLMDIPGVTAVQVAPAYGGVSMVELTGASTDPATVTRALWHAGFRTASQKQQRTKR